MTAMEPMMTENQDVPETQVIGQEPTELDLLAEDIRQLHRKVTNEEAAIAEARRKLGERENRSQDDQKKLGNLLLDARKLVPHGSWMPWVEANLPGLGLRQAQRYMCMVRRSLPTDPMKDPAVVKPETEPNTTKPEMSHLPDPVEVEERAAIQAEADAPDVDFDEDNAQTENKEEPSGCPDLAKAIIDEMTDEIERLNAADIDDSVEQALIHLQLAVEAAIVRRKHYGSDVLNSRDQFYKSKYAAGLS